MVENKLKQYSKAILNKYKESENGERYAKFLSEKGYKKKDFEERSIREQSVEIITFFDDNEWEIPHRTRKRRENTNIENNDCLSLIQKINISVKCNDSKKVELTNKAITLSTKEKELAELRKEIDAIKAEINAVI